MTSTNSPCATTSPCATSPCATPVAERPRYYPRQIITPDDLMLEQEYFRNKLRRHNRLMHGWGVVCGAQVCPTPQPAPATASAPSTLPPSYQPYMVTVTSGYILGPYGDEILIDCCRSVDVRTTGTSGVTGDPCVQVSDPWCTSAMVQAGSSATIYVAVKYQECQGRPVRVQPLGCGCNDSTCEYPRLQDGYEIGILTSNPMAGAQAPEADLDVVLNCPMPACPPCPPQPWVLLATVSVDGNGNITTVDNTVRRLVASFGNFWWQCTTPAQVPAITSIAPQSGGAGATLQLVVGQQNTVVVTFASPPDCSLALNATSVALTLGSQIPVTYFAPTGVNAATYTLNFTVPASASSATTLAISIPPSGSSAQTLSVPVVVVAPATPFVAKKAQPAKQVASTTATPAKATPAKPDVSAAPATPATADTPAAATPAAPATPDTSPAAGADKADADAAATPDTPADDGKKKKKS